MSLTRAIWAFALLHATLYVSLLPLWEGFDEPYHYGYVQELALRGTLPVSQRSTLNEEIWQSMMLAPASHLNARNMPALTSFTEYFRLPAEERERRRARIATLEPALRERAAGGFNYEAQQPPLGYLPLAAAEWFQRNAPLPNRIWRLRLIAAAAGVALLAWTAMRLGERLRLKPGSMAAALLLLFSTQNLYGAVAHVASEWLAVPLIALTLLAADRYWGAPGKGNAALLGLTLAAGLLAKSYFLVFVPFALGLVLWRGWRNVNPLAAGLAVAAPWYGRNVALYGNLTGLQPSVAAIPREAVIDSFLAVDWPAAIPGLARGALWNANNSFTTYSAGTLNLMLVLMAAGAVLLLRKWRELPGRPAALIVAGGSIVFTAIPVYAMVLFAVLFGREYPNANSWYSAGLLPGAFLLACAGCAEGGRAGRWLLRGLLAVSTVVLAGTYFAKLLPMYAGFAGAARLGRLAQIYGGQREELMARLGQSALGPAWFVLALAAATVLLGAALAWRTARALE